MGSDVDDIVENCRRGEDDAIGVDGPQLLAAFGIEGIHFDVGVGRSDIDYSIDNGWRIVGSKIQTSLRPW